jgi:hypothetical protein
MIGLLLKQSTILLKHPTQIVVDDVDQPDSNEQEDNGVARIDVVYKLPHTFSRIATRTVKGLNYHKEQRPHQLNTERVDVTEKTNLRFVRGLLRMVVQTRDLNDQRVDQLFLKDEIGNKENPIEDQVRYYNEDIVSHRHNLIVIDNKHAYSIKAKPFSHQNSPHS